MSTNVPDPLPRKDYLHSDLVPDDLATLVTDLALAVVEANTRLAGSFAIPEAEIEVKVALTRLNERNITGGASLKLGVFALNASYTSRYSFKEEAASRIRIKLVAGTGTKTPA